jgi:hypothetical protein
MSFPLGQTPSHDYRSYVPIDHFTMSRKGRPAKGPSLDGSSLQIDYYKPQKSLGKEVIPSDKEWIGKIPSLAASEIFHEIMANLLYRSVFADKNIKVPPALVSRVKVHNSLLLELGLNDSLAVMTKKVTNFHAFGPLLVEQLQKKERTPLTIPHPTKPNENIPVSDFWLLAAYSKWFGDVDFVGASGGNAGYQIKQDQRGQLNVRTTKIDPSYVGRGDRNVKDDSSQPIQSTSIQYSPRDKISFDHLLPEEKKEFLKALKEIVNYTDQDIEGFFSSFTSRIDDVPSEFRKGVEKELTDLKSFLIKRREQLRKVYHQGSEKRENQLVRK